MPNELSVRKPGEVVAQDLEDRGLLQDREADRLLILIHGYQNSEDKARRSFERFQDGLRAVAGARARTIGTTWYFHWPGSHPVGPISVLTYSNKVSAAALSGERLARQWLAYRKRHQEVVIVAHSLGCRVAVEAIKTIQLMRKEPYGYRGAHVQAVFLLAAAVPVSLCVPGESFSRPFDEHSREHAFHSRSDRVLQRPFRMGQFLASEYGPAVGRDGDPYRRWTSRHATGLTHSRYWASNYVAQWVCELLGLPGWRTFDKRLLPSSEIADDERAIGTDSLPERAPPQRFM